MAVLRTLSFLIASGTMTGALFLLLAISGADVGTDDVNRMVFYVSPAILSSSVMLWICKSPTQQAVMISGALIALASTIIYAIIFLRRGHQFDLYFGISCAVMSFISWLIWLVSADRHDRNSQRHSGSIRGNRA